MDVQVGRKGERVVLEVADTGPGIPPDRIARIFDEPADDEADFADVKLTVNVEQRDIRRIQVGQEVDIAIYALPDETFTGVVDLLQPAAIAATHMAAARPLTRRSRRDLS